MFEKILKTNNAFLLEIERRFYSMLQYEDKRLQSKALDVMPVTLLEQRAQERMRGLQTEVRKGIIEDVNVSIQEMLIVELLDWFKNNFFEWVDSPDCDYCDGRTKFSHMSTDPAIVKDANRVEMHQCQSCKKFTPFHRYTDLEILLETREGRCGEWASVFTLLCRALGLDARYICDETDHVWTEVYSIAQKRWLHCDPCENICDNPLVYENGWGKRLSYVIAYSWDEIQDVTWRYTSDHYKILRNRRHCAENELVQALVVLREHQQKSLSEARRNYLTRRLLYELAELMIEKKPNDSEMQGRISGSLAWRLDRGETTENTSENYIWIPTDREITSSQMTIRYSPSLDRYERARMDDTTEVLKSWKAGVFSCRDIFRKEEKDWKIVYLCRKEHSTEGEIKWQFKSSSSDKVIDKVKIELSYTIFENAVIEINLYGGDKCIRVPNAERSLTTSELSGSTSVTLTVVLKGGKGSCAWQHAQLFRQSTNSSDYPFLVNITFKPRC